MMEQVMKSTGNDNTEFEVVNDLNLYVIEKIYRGSEICLQSCEYPENLLKSISIALPKTSGIIEFSNHRTVILMSIAMKIILKIKIIPMLCFIRRKHSDYHVSHRTRKKIKTTVLFLKRLVKKCIEKQKKKCTYFLLTN